MARYSLLFKDTAYFELMKQCEKEKLTMGRKLNNIINDHLTNAKDTGKVSGNHCFFCGLPPRYELRGFNGRMLYVCFVHGKLRNLVKSYRDMETPV